MSDYSLTPAQQILRHHAAELAMVREGHSMPYQDAIIRMKSGQYFASLAMMLENLKSDPYIEIDTIKFIIGGFAEELIYLQDAYKIVKR